MDTILTNIINYLKEQGKTQKQLCDHLHIGKQALTNWKSGNNKSYMSKLKEIAEFLNCSILELYGVEDCLPKTEETPIELSNEEIELIKSYRLLNDENKKNLRSTILTFLLEE